MVGDARGRALETLERLWDEEVALLRMLVAEPSVRGNTNSVQRLIADQMRAAGLEVTEEGIDLAAISALPGFSPPEWPYDGMINLVGHRPGAGGGRSLLLNGHIDVVSAEPLAHWEHDPWAGEIDQGRMYGRGACDMKSGVAAMLTIAKAFRVSDVDLRGDLLLTTVIDEECGGNGTLSTLAQGHRADAVIIPEPTDLQVTAAHPGVLWFRIVVRGQGGHAQSAFGAVNAIEKAFLIIAGLRELEAAWNRPERRHPALASLEHPLNLNIGTVHAGDWPSSVPEECILEIRFAYYPGTALADAQNAIRDHITEVSRRDEWLRHHPPEVTFFGFAAEPAIYDLDTPIFRTLQANHEAVTHTSLCSGPSAATIDNRFYQLYRDLPALAYGASGGALHAPDEWVDLESLRTATTVLAGTVMDWCGIR